MYRLARAILFVFPAELAHRMVMWLLGLLDGALPLARRMRARATAGVDLATTVAGVPFPNPIGLAAGLDKDAEAMVGLFALGFGFIEVGTVTPRPQEGNPKPRLFRLPAQRALINRMGFNNHGLHAAAGNLRELAWRPGPVGVNIGKNKDTPLADATADYLACARELGPLADYVVVNASSPNTPGLRTLQEPEVLAGLLEAVRRETDRPLFLKIAPDLAPEAVDAIVDVAIAARVDGLICTNTTLARPFAVAEAGGLSGAPLEEPSNQVIRRAYARSNGKLPIVGVGGVFDAAGAYAKIRAGASLVQVYTGFVYEGPALVRRILRELPALLRRDGFSSVSEAVGSESRASPSPLSTESRALDVELDGDRGAQNR